MTAFADHVRKKAFTHVVLIGMGGSSLSPEVCGEIFGPAKAWPELLVLDSTDPAAVRDIERRIDLAHTLFIVASKSGTTTETDSFYQYFWKATREAVSTPGDHFIAITDPGTPLAKEAHMWTMSWRQSRRRWTIVTSLAWRRRS